MIRSRPARHPLLTPLIERLWLFRSPGFAHAFEWILPSARPQVLVNLVEDELRVGRGAVERLPGAVLEGPFDTPFLIDTRQQQAIAGVTFRPGALGSWVSGPELTGTRIALQDLYSGDLRDRLLGGGSDAAVLDRLERVMLETRLRPPDLRMAAAARALESGMPVGVAADRLGMGSRHFRQQFLQRTGMLPKRYARVRRLQRVLPLVGEMEWGAIAYRIGFADQAHLSREFRALTGMPPSTYRCRLPGQVNHVVASPHS